MGCTAHCCLLSLGEIFELKAELNSDKKEKKKEAVKKVIASMTVGKDVRYTGESWGQPGADQQEHLAPLTNLMSKHRILFAHE